VYDCARFFKAFFNGFFALTRKVGCMSLTRHDVENIALLARLAITEEEQSVYADSLSKILSFVEQLNAADVANVEPMAHPLADQVQRLRVDEVLEQDQHEKYQRNAPRVEAGLYLVPKVIE
jgi:aspartyl-tRNA(Asn)/glutamyl-tRNA(Gln) amidotransferase subunit C